MKQTDLSTPGGRLRAIKEAKGVASYELAADLDKDRSSVSKLETGKIKGELDTWINVSNELDVPLDYFFRLTDVQCVAFLKSVTGELFPDDLPDPDQVERNKLRLAIDTALDQMSLRQMKLAASVLMEFGLEEAASTPRTNGVQSNDVSHSAPADFQGAAKRAAGKAKPAS